MKAEEENIIQCDLYVYLHLLYVYLPQDTGHCYTSSNPKCADVLYAQVC